MNKNAKNIILVILLIVLLVLLGVLYVNRKAIKDSILESNLNRKFNNFYGSVYENKDDLVTILIDSEYQNTFDNQEYITILVNDNNLVQGDHIKVYYDKNKLDVIKSGDELLDNPIIEVLGKARMFNQEVNTPVSNSSYPAGTTIFSSLSVYDTDETFIDDLYQSNSGFYFKKIVDFKEYEKYKKLIPNLRDLTEDDFVNYYLILVLSTNSDIVYTYKNSELDVTTDGTTKCTINLKENQDLADRAKRPTFTGIYLIVPNFNDLKLENISVNSSDKIYE